MDKTVLRRLEKCESLILHKDCSHINVKEKSKGTKGGFLNLFKWFSRKDVKYNSSVNLQGEAYSSNSNSSCDPLLIPLKHSISADNADGLMKSHKKSSGYISTFQGTKCKSAGKKSSATGSSDVITALRTRKRRAPIPPGTFKQNANFNPFYRSFDSSSLRDEDELSKTHSESSIYSKVKRKAPQPPNSFTASSSNSQEKNNCVTIRPSSTFSNVSSLSYSTSSTIKSTTCSEDGISNYSDALKCNSMFPVCKEKETLSPKPWYKRKTSKIVKDKKKSILKETQYDMLMPDIQFSRPKLDSDISPQESTQKIPNNNRLSFLSTISDLDRAAVEHIQREKAQKEAARVELDQKFYQTSSTLILNQEHIMPNKQDIGLSKTFEKKLTIKNDSCIPDNVNLGMYDNLQYKNKCLVDDLCHVPQAPCESSLSSSNRSIDNFNSLTSGNNGSILEFMGHSELNELQNMKINYDEYLEEIKKEIDNDVLSSCNSGSLKETPLQKACFDPELFYQLAKDANVTCGAKLSNYSPKQTVSKIGKLDCGNSNKSPQAKRSPKNFGLRMNNFFTPDVSVIMEASESLTSSNTTNTPAEDSLAASSFIIEPSNDFMSIASDIHSEFKVNTCDLQEMIESFAIDFKRKEEEENRQGSFESKSKADRIREEILLVREKDNFLAWQKAMQEMDYNKIDSTISMEKKNKWICGVCTLVNQPWRINCEACSALRPPNPKRVNGVPEKNLDTVSTENKISSNHIKGNTGYNSSENFCNGQLEAKSMPSSNWENELQGYINIFDGEANNIRQIDIGSVRNQLFNSHSANLSKDANGENIFSEEENGNQNVTRDSNINTEDSNYKIQHEIEREHIRNTRLRHFEQLQRNFDSTTASNHSQSNLSIEYISKNKDNSETEEYKDLNLSSDNKCFYKNDFKKSQILKPSGAVKNVVSIFNQLDQFNQSLVIEKGASTKFVKRKPLCTSQSFKDFENLFNNSSSSSSKKDVQSAARCISPIKADIDIMSAINKFDEMAAIAEIEKINKPSPKTTKWKPKFCDIVSSSLLTTTTSLSQIKLTNGNKISFNSIDSKSKVFSKIAPNPVPQQENFLDSNRDSCESVIRDGILYTTGESRKRSMSIGSGTFELFSAKDFATIEAHHSRKPSPINDVDFLALSESSPLLMPEIIVENSNDHVSKEGKYNVSGFEKLCQDLTNSYGISNFKANLKKDELHLGELTTRMINLQLEELEQAIFEKRHLDVSQLAINLAKLKFSCLAGDDSNSLESIVEPKISQLNCLKVEKFSDCLETRNEENLITTCVGSATSSTSDSSIDKDLATNITDDIFLSLNGSENSQELDSGCEAEVVRRSTKVDPSRREIKSDISNGLSHSSVEHENKYFNVKMFVEDKSSHQGPIMISVNSLMSLKNLKTKISEDFGFPYEVQRWILGRQLAEDESKSLEDYNVSASGCPIFLYLVAPEIKRSLKPSRNSSKPLVKEDIHFIKHQPTVSNQKLKRKLQKKNSAASLIKHKKESNIKKEDESTTVNNNNYPIQQAQYIDTSNDKIMDEDSGSHIKMLNNRMETELDDAMENWICPRCTLVNPMQRPGCEACTTERPHQLFKNESLPNAKMDLSQAMKALESHGCVPNLESFECLVCFTQLKSGEGVVLRDCLHQFCRDCLADAVKYSDTAEVKCPFSNRNYSCQFSLQQREIRDLLTEDEYRKHLDKSVKEAAGAMKNVFYCKTPDCKGFCQYEDNVNVFNCDVCNKLNCLTCQSQHEGVSCKQYQDELLNKQDEATLKTKQFFDDIIRRGDGMFCPQCSVMLVRKWGCDWMRCPMCKTEICWVTRGLRWGPEGQGDISGGCKCGVHGRKCHPKCTYCH